MQKMMTIKDASIWASKYLEKMLLHQIYLT